MAAAGPEWVLAIDFGTTATAAVIGVNGQLTALALDGAGRMPSSVYAEDTGVLLVGQSADHAAGYALHRYEPTPKRRVGQSRVPLGEQEYTPAQLIGAVFTRVLREAVTQHDGNPPTRMVLTHPVRWRRPRRTILADAARHAAQDLGLDAVPEPVFVPEPVAAAHATGHDAPTEGDCFGVYDLGGGTFDAAVLQKTSDGFTVLHSGGIDPLGGVDFDHRLFTYLGDRYIAPADPGLWSALCRADPEDPDLSERRLRLQTRVRLLREDLSTHRTLNCHLPGVRTAAMITSSEYETLIRADVNATVDELEETITRAGLTPADLTAIYRIGGAAATPLIGFTLDRLQRPVRTSNDPKTIVAQGAASAPAPPPAATDPVSTPVAASKTPDIHTADGRSVDEPQKAIDVNAQRAATAVSTVGRLHNPPDTKTGAQRACPQAPTADANPVELGETDLADPLPRPMGKGAWGCVLAGTVFIAAAVFYDLVPVGGDFKDAVRVPSAFLAIIGALLIGAALRTRTGATRGIVLVGAVLVTAAACGLLAALLPNGNDQVYDHEVAVSFGLAMVGVLLVVVPVWRRAPSRGVVIGFALAGFGLLIADLSELIVLKLSQLTSDAYCPRSTVAYFLAGGFDAICSRLANHQITQGAIVAGVGVLLVAAGWLGSRSRRQAREARPAEPTTRPSWWRRKSLAAVVLVLVVVGGVLGFTLWPSPPSPPPPTPGFTPTTSPYTPAPSSVPTGSPAGLQKLLSLLPRGYPASACTPQTPTTNAVVEVGCRANLDQGGPAAAVFTLYTNPAAMNADYQRTIAQTTPAPCAPNLSSSSAPWHRPNTPTQVAGMISCGTQQGTPDVVWTDNANLVLSTTLGPDAAALHQWWVSHG